jgi:8-oxo-dGTP diphosphatase
VPADFGRGDDVAGHRPPNELIRCATLHGGQTARPAADFRFRPAAYGVAVRDGRILLGRSVFSGLWDIPGGAVEPWETLPEGLVREFREETGVEVTVGPLLHFSESFIAIFAHAYHSLRFYYRVTVPPDAELRPQRTEITDLAWVDIAACHPADFAPGDRDILLRALRA